MGNGLKICPKLTIQHTELTSFSIMNVRLAALSATTANIHKEYCNDEVSGTAEFCKQIVQKRIYESGKNHLKVVRMRDLIGYKLFSWLFKKLEEQY